MDRRPLFPPIEARVTGMLPVGDGHTLYWEESGDPSGPAAIFLHGGPGGGTAPSHRRFFDPSYRIILLDQRGCGRSTPTASLEGNTTWHLVDDLERLREHLGIEQWLVFGGSWGSTLALAYAQTHPARVSAMVLRGIFLVRPWEISWFYQEGCSHLFPDAWQDFLAPIPVDERGDLLAAYHRRLTDADPAVRLPAARAWSIWEARTSNLVTDPEVVARFQDDTTANVFARIECHYFVQDCWLSGERALLKNVDRIRHIPCVIVQGRYDVVCPMTSAWALHEAWPEADLRVVVDAGHSAFEPGIVHELVEATDRLLGVVASMS